MSGVHECVFVEEQEPSGRLVLPPCLVCDRTAMDALQPMALMPETYRLVTTEGFPHGLRCMDCDRSIGNGQPYGRSLGGVTSEGLLVGVLKCVYCALGGAPPADEGGTR